MPVRRSSKVLSAEEVRRLKRDAERIDREERDAIQCEGRAVKVRHERLRDIVQVLKAARQRLGLSRTPRVRALGSAEGHDVSNGCKPVPAFDQPRNLLPFP